MAPQRLSSSRGPASTESSPVSQEKQATSIRKELGLSQVDSAFAIGQSGGVVVVMQELHDESAFDTGDFAVSKSRFDKRKDAQKEREAELRRKKEEERKAAIALKKEMEAKAAREAAAAAAAAKEAERKAAEEERKKKQQERKKERGPVPAPPPPEQPPKPERAARKPKAPKASIEEPAAPQVPQSEGSKAILQDSAVVGIGNVIASSPRSAKKPAAPVVAPIVAPKPVLVHAAAQTDPVKILPIDAPATVSGSSPSAAAAWWLQQAASQAPAPQQPAPNAQGDQYMMQAYIDAMQRIAPHQQPSSYGYWTAPAAQPSAADLYWQQQQNVYQTGPAGGRYGTTAPRRI